MGGAKGPPLCYSTGRGQPRYPVSVHIFLLKALPPLIPRDMQFCGEVTPQEDGPEGEATKVLEAGRGHLDRDL